MDKIPAHIYALIDPRTSEIRYVGQTVMSDPKRRYNYHMGEARKGVKNHKANWIRQVLADGNTPELRVLESGTWSKEARDDREVAWIAELRSGGAPLTNTELGGSSGVTWTLESRQKLSESIKLWHEGRKSRGLTDCLGDAEARARRVATRNAWLLTPEGIEWRAVQSERNRQRWVDEPDRMMEIARSPERRAKIAEATIERYRDPEERAKTGLAVSAAMTDEGKQRISAATLARHGYDSKITEIPCAQCGETFLPPRRSTKLCSLACRGAWVARVKKEKSNR